MAIRGSNGSARMFTDSPEYGYLIPRIERVELSMLWQSGRSLNSDRGVPPGPHTCRSGYWALGAGLSLPFVEWDVETRRRNIVSRLRDRHQTYSTHTDTQHTWYLGTDTSLRRLIAKILPPI